MYTLLVRDSFDAAHFLPDHKGKCADVHGHRWEVEVEVASRELAGGRMVMDFADIKYALRTVLSCFDHKMLNDVPSFTITSPTAENIATVILRRINEQIPGVTAVTVWETASCGARFEA